MKKLANLYLLINIIIMLPLISLRAYAESGADIPIIIDVRSHFEFYTGHIDDALHIPYKSIGAKIQQHAPDKDQTIIVYCGSGHRSGIAKTTLESMGYLKVENGGGLDDMRQRSTNSPQPQD